MASRKQVEANKANAKKSTGPKTETGKSRSRMNAVTHGLTAEVIVTPDEDAEAFSEFREALMQHYDPEGTLQCELVERIASLYWRLRRAPIFEAAILDYRRDVVLGKEAEEQEREQQEWARERERQAFRDEVVARARKDRGEEIVEDEEDEHEEDEDHEEVDEGVALLESSVRLGRALGDDAKYGNALGKLGRHETTLMSNLAKTQQMLLDLQGSRRQTEAAATEEDEEEPTTPTRRAA
jgi:hypothetical protein